MKPTPLSYPFIGVLYMLVQVCYMLYINVLSMNEPSNCPWVNNEQISFNFPT